MAKYTYVLNPLLSTALLLLSFRVFSPLVFIILESVWTYGLLLGVAVFALSLQSKTLIQKGKAQTPFVMFRAGTLLFAAFLLIHSLLLPNALITNLRYLGFLAIGYLMSARISGAQTRELLERAAAFFSYYLLFASVVYSLVAFGVLDLNPWHVDDLSLISEQNPLSIRKDFDYFLPWYSLVFAASPAEVGTVAELAYLERYRAIFAEPTQVVHFVIPLLFFSLSLFSTRSMRALFLSASLAISCFWAESAAGYLSILLLLYFLLGARLLARVHSSLLRVPLTAICLFVPLYALFTGFTDIIALFGVSKLESFLHYADRYADTLAALREAGFFGFGFEQDLGVVTNGLVINSFRYGSIGIAAVTLFLAPLAYYSWSLLSSRFFAAGLTGLATLLLFLKSPEILNLHLIFFYVYVLHAESQRRLSLVANSAENHYPLSISEQIPQAATG